MLAAAASADAYTPTGVHGIPLIPGAEIRIARIGYDARDRMVSVAAPGVSATYGYDTNNLRVRMDDGAGDRRVLLDGRTARFSGYTEEAAEYEVSTAERMARYDHDPSRVDGLVSQMVSAVKTHALVDAIGSAQSLTNAAGLEVTRYTFDAYGARTAQVEATSTAWGFTARRVDSTGLNYYRARYYDPTTGAFGARDPAGVTFLSSRITDVFGSWQHTNSYRYVRNNPTNMTDPSGRVELAAGDVFSNCGFECEEKILNAWKMGVQTAKGAGAQPKCRKFFEETLGAPLTLPQLIESPVPVYFRGWPSRWLLRMWDDVNSVTLPGDQTIYMNCDRMQDTKVVSDMSQFIGWKLIHELAHIANYIAAGDDAFDTGLKTIDEGDLAENACFGYGYP